MQQRSDPLSRLMLAHQEFSSAHQLERDLLLKRSKGTKHGYGLGIALGTVGGGWFRRR